LLPALNNFQIPVTFSVLIIIIIIIIIIWEGRSPHLQAMTGKELF